MDVEADLYSTYSCVYWLAGWYWMSLVMVAIPCLNVFTRDVAMIDA